MALTTGQKFVRVVYLMRGLNNPRVGRRMLRHGFTQADLEEGWRLFMEAVGSKLSIARHLPPDPGLFERLDAWENYWFPVVFATLQRHYPEICDEVFLNLKQTEGVEVAITVGTLVRRVREMQRRDAEEQQAAAQLLEKRGLDEETLAQAEAMLGELRTDPEALEPAPTVDQAAAVEAMWAWYLEWSSIARQAIQNRNLLRALGFLRRPSSGTDPELADEQEDPSDESEAAAPTPTPSPATSLGTSETT
jgi:hypothetical protein